MDAKVKSDWVAALRSGNYKQGKNVLHNVTANTYCCLGVLCDLAVGAGVVQENELGHFYAPVGYKHGGLLPKAVADWAGLDSDNPWIADVPDPVSAVYANDTLNLTFAQIADLVEGNL